MQVTLLGSQKELDIHFCHKAMNKTGCLNQSNSLIYQIINAQPGSNDSVIWYLWVWRIKHSLCGDSQVQLTCNESYYSILKSAFTAHTCHVCDWLLQTQTFKGNHATHKGYYIAPWSPEVLVNVKLLCCEAQEKLWIVLQLLYACICIFLSLYRWLNTRPCLRINLLCFQGSIIVKLYKNSPLVL